MPLGYFACFLSSVDFFFKIISFLEKSFQENHQSVKQFGSIQNVWPDLGPNCLQNLSADVTRRYRVDQSQLLALEALNTKENIKHQY